MFFGKTNSISLDGSTARCTFVASNDVPGIHKPARLGCWFPIYGDCWVPLPEETRSARLLNLEPPVLVPLPLLSPSFASLCSSSLPKESGVCLQNREYGYCSATPGAEYSCAMVLGRRCKTIFRTWSASILEYRAASPAGFISNLG